MIKKYEIGNTKYEIKTRAGFTVLESIIAIFILSLSITGVFSAVQQSLSQSIIAKDEVRAFYLAQEAVEIIRNKRETNHLDKLINGSSNTWLFGIAENAADPCYFGKTCMVDANTFSLTYCGLSWGSCAPLRQNATSFLYGYNSTWNLTNIRREIQLESIAPDEIAVTVRVSWTSGFVTREFKVKTHLFKWI